ncbi:MAG: hypothetical protein QM737_22545 [Ferruginibacter sp.]
MKKIKSFIIILIILVPGFSYGQQIFNQTRILGSWTFERVEFLSRMEDSLNFLKNISNSTITFEPINKVTVKIRRDSTEKIRNSTYSMSADGTTLTNNGVESKIMKLTDEELVMKVEDESVFIIHFKRVLSN